MPSSITRAAIHTGSQTEFDGVPSAMRWILEIHLHHPDKTCGAFFEDMLLDDGCYA